MGSPISQLPAGLEVVSFSLSSAKARIKVLTGVRPSPTSALKTERRRSVLGCVGLFADTCDYMIGCVLVGNTRYTLTFLTPTPTPLPWPLPPYVAAVVAAADASAPLLLAATNACRCCRSGCCRYSLPPLLLVLACCHCCCRRRRCCCCRRRCTQKQSTAGAMRTGGGPRRSYAQRERAHRMSACQPRGARAGSGSRVPGSGGKGVGRRRAAWPTRWHGFLAVRGAPDEIAALACRPGKPRQDGSTTHEGRPDSHSGQPSPPPQRCPGA